MKAQQQLFKAVPYALAAEPPNEGQALQLAKAANVSKQVWIAVCFEQIALTACGSPTDQAFVVIQISKGQTVIYNANELALSQGIMPGMPLNSAYALCHNLQVRMRNELKEATILESYAQQAAMFTPNLALSGGDVLLLEVSASLKLFKGINNIINEISNLFKAKHAIASTPVADASQLLSRNGINISVPKAASLQSVLGSLSLSSTPLSNKLITQLSNCGLSCLRDIWRLPQADLARRFGAVLPQFLDLLSGKRLKPHAYYKPPVGFELTIDLPSDTSDNTTLLIAAERLLDKAQRFLQIRSVAAQVMAFSFTYVGYRSEGLARCELIIRSQQASYQKEVFLPQLTEQLQRTEFDRSVIAVSLKIDQVLEHQPGNQVLFGQQEQNQQDWQTLLGILSARLGEKAVCRLQSQEDHRPEKAWRRVSLDRPYKKQQTQKTDEQTNQRPLWLLLKPVAYSGSLKRLKRLSDHERIEAGWWQGKDARRDYCSVKTPSGAKVWLYQDICQQMNSRRQAGQQVMQQTRSMWYVHGLFA